MTDERSGRSRVAAQCAVAAFAVALSLIPIRLFAQTTVRGTPLQSQARTPDPSRGGPAAPATARNPQAAITPFRLSAVSIIGSSLSPETLAVAFRDFVGKTVDNAQLGAITNRIAAAYAKSDVALYTMFVPDQDFAEGRLTLRVTEGYVSGIEIRGHLRANRVRLLRSYMRRLERERPLHTSTLQRVISLIKDVPGLVPTISFEAGAQGAVKLIVSATEKAVQLGAGINDQGTALLGKTQGQADLFLNGILSGADQLHATIVVPTHVDHFQYGAIAYSAPLDHDGTTLTANASYLRTRPSAVPLTGDAVSFGMQLSHPFLRGYTRNLYGTLAMDGIDSDNALLGYAISNDRVRTLRASLSYVAAGKRNQFSASMTASFGLAVLGARVAEGQADRRFRKLGVKIGDNQQIGKNFVLRLNGFGQATGDDLPASEQAALGGEEFGRAYPAALIVGDTAYAGSLELAWRPARLPKGLAGSELFLFSDDGGVSYRSRFGSPPVASHLASVGGGVRLELLSRSIVQIEATHGLSDPVSYGFRRPTRVLFSIRSVL